MIPIPTLCLCRCPSQRRAGKSFPNGILLFLAVALSILGLTAMPVTAQVLTKDTAWSGTVTIAEDIVVPEGITLTIAPGTIIKIAQAESTKTDPEYLSPLTEITIRGSLRAEGNEAAPIAFLAETTGIPGNWAGILVDGGTASFRHCSIKDADTGLHVFSGTADLNNSLIRGNRYGVTAQGSGSHVRMTATTVRENDYGQSTLSGGKITATGSTVTANRKRDSIEWQGPAIPEPAGYQSPAGRPVARIYRDEALLGDTIWQGRIEITGQVRIPEAARLIILPGTIVAFRKRDTNGDGIGENGILIQGILIAKGTKTEPIIFKSAELQPKRGDWDAINLMNSDGVQNLIEYCRIEDAYRGLHFHFSNVLVNHSNFRNSYRAIQFQESQVDIRNNRFYANKSAVQGRDSDVRFTGNLVQGNLHGINMYRTTVSLRANRFFGNSLDGLRLRDSSAIVERNIIDANRYGLMSQDSFSGRYAENIIANNAELGLSLKNLDNLELIGNFIAGNGMNGASIQEVRALIQGNSFTDNGERGMGIVSFDGSITGNNFAANGLYAIDLEGKQDIAAPGNWWGGDNPDKVIFDRHDQPLRGMVQTALPSATPLPFRWVMRDMPLSLTWRGEVLVESSLAVPSGITLSVAPGTKVQMGADVSIAIRGKLLAKGKRGERITFTSIGPPQPGGWGEILMERATGSVVEFCDFTAGTWGLHSHFTNLAVSQSRFTGNFGGIRFRSGPVTISNSLFRGNSIGIRSYRGNARIAGNSITGNDIGIFVREKGSGLDITGNDLSNNSDYGIRIGDFNDEDVRAGGNWWGDGDPASHIFDAHREPGIGYVRYEPVLKSPVRTGPEE